jgi:glycine cleavage system aminomethyltransferase T
VSGEGALNTLEWLCTAPMDNPIGTSKYSLMLNESGGIEADITGDSFLLCQQK